MLEELKELVCAANTALPRYGLSIFTWGNVSGIDRARGLVVIKPSGVAYDQMKSRDMVVVDLATGKTVEGENCPSTDTPTHLEIYRAFPHVGGIVHTHSRYATSWAQACRSIPVLGTTHADHFCGEIPCTRALTAEEIRGDYEAATGALIVETVAGRDPMAVSAVLVASHGPFVWSETAGEAVRQAVVLEEVARMAYYSVTLAPGTSLSISDALLEKHYRRKHGAGAYYGQKHASDNG